MIWEHAVVAHTSADVKGSLVAPSRLSSFQTSLTKKRIVDAHLAIPVCAQGANDVGQTDGLRATNEAQGSVKHRIV